MVMDPKSTALSRRGIIGAFAGTAMLAAASVAGVSGQANAQDVTAQPVISSEDCTWQQELCELRAAADAARNYAEENPGVGILIHVGQDFPNAHFENAAQFGQAFVNAFAAQGVEARYFLSPNDAPNTVMSYYIGHLIHGQHNGTEVKTLRQARIAIPEVAEQVRVLNGLAQADDVRPGLEGG